MIRFVNLCRLFLPFYFRLYLYYYYYYSFALDIILALFSVYSSSPLDFVCFFPPALSSLILN